MGFLDKTRQAEADKRADKAQEARDAGLRADVLMNTVGINSEVVIFTVARPR